MYIVNMLKRVPVREQNPDIRINNFEEVCFGYTYNEAQAESAVAYNVKIPNVFKDVPYLLIFRFIGKIVEGI